MKSFSRVFALLAGILFSAFAHAETLTTEQFENRLGNGKLRFIESGKRMVDETGVLVGQGVVVDRSKGAISFVPTPTQPTRVKPKLCVASPGCAEPVKPAALPSLAQMLGASGEESCNVECDDVELCRPCANPQQAGDQCCQTRRQCTRNCEAAARATDDELPYIEPAGPALE